MHTTSHLTLALLITLAVCTVSRTGAAGDTAPNQPPTLFYPTDGESGVPVDSHIWLKGGTVGQGDGESESENSGPRFVLRAGDSEAPLEWKYDGTINDVTEPALAHLVLPADVQLKSGEEYEVVFFAPGDEKGAVLGSFTAGDGPVAPGEVPEIVESELEETGERPPEEEGGGAPTTRALVTVKVPDDTIYLLKLQNGGIHQYHLVRDGGTHKLTILGIRNPEKCVRLTAFTLRETVLGRDEWCE